MQARFVWHNWLVFSNRFFCCCIPYKHTFEIQKAKIRVRGTTLNQRKMKKNDSQQLVGELIHNRLKQFLRCILVQGVKAQTIHFLKSIFRKNHCQYINKRYISRKPLISALVWHPENRRGIIMRMPRPPELKTLRAHLCFSRQGGVAPSW